ncbi:MAG: 50S ribosomal protein L30e [Candidatus Altiarchaeota archaeon]|nr:50S ribosomal protein L30e [Candidatus Altiarchaeota archaeon]
MKGLRDEISSVIKTGKTVIGSKETTKSLLIGNPKLVILSSNCPEEERESITYYSKLVNVPLEVTKEDSIELGSICGKPFPVSAIGVLESGESDIISGSKKDGKDKAGD